MTHECIAAVFEAGRAADGRAFLAMEHVPGVPITEYCDRRARSIEERLALFVRVCDGVQHAHHKGIVHRDLKPAHILVTEEGRTASPKIIDFGSAKRPPTPEDLATRPGLPLGTPAYMSPEQAAGEPDVDTRGDVYALGIVLCELLTGAVPFARERLVAAGSPGMAAILRSEEPAISTRSCAPRSSASATTVTRRRARWLRTSNVSSAGG